jgi:hypothetical protein
MSLEKLRDAFAPDAPKPDYAGLMRAISGDAGLVPVRFIEFIRPNGRREDRELMLPKSSAEKAEWLWSNGFRLTAELCPPNLIHVVADDPKGERDVANELVPNDKEHFAPAAVIVIDRAYERLTTERSKKKKKS